MIVKNWCKLISIFRDGVFIINLCRVKKISLDELTIIPPFLRFDNVQLCYNRGSQPIVRKCEFIENHLLPFKSALKDSNMVQFTAGIYEFNRSHFSDHEQLLEYILNRFLQICTSICGYKFNIYFYSNANYARNVISSILKSDEIKRRSNIEIIIDSGEKIHLPIEAISNWLLKSVDGMENDVQNRKEKFLKIQLYDGIQNAHEMIDYLATVGFF